MVYSTCFILCINETKPLEKSDLSINFNFIIISWIHVYEHAHTQTQYAAAAAAVAAAICTCTFTIGMEWNGIQEPINNCTKTI